jgi:hypothetical protein
LYHRTESFIDLKSRDKQKTELCKKQGITLIEVPYWWDRKSSSLAVTVYTIRPDLFSQIPLGVAIPTIPPQTRQKNTTGNKILIFFL